MSENTKAENYYYKLIHFSIPCIECCLNDIPEDECDSGTWLYFNEENFQVYRECELSDDHDNDFTGFWNNRNDVADLNMELDELDMSYEKVLEINKVQNV